MQIQQCHKIVHKIYNVDQILYILSNIVYNSSYIPMILQYTLYSDHIRSHTMILDTIAMLK